MTIPAGAAIDEKLERLYELLEDIETATLTTRRADGSLISRPMATQRRAEGSHFWFVAPRNAPKVGEIERDPNVNLAYFRSRSREWISVSGVARISRDPAKIRELYEPAWKAWFPDEGGRKNGGPEDPRIVLIGVEARSAHTTTVGRRAPVALLDHFGSAASLPEATDELGDGDRVAPDAWRR